MAGTWPNRKQHDPRLVELYAAGELIAGKYQLKRVLGVGGMGTVWLATNTILEVDVALKLLRSDFEGQAEASQRFLHEARATAKLRHPSIVRLHDFGTTHHGHAFMVMEYLEGQPLSDILDEREQMPATEAVQLLLQVLDGLDLAHEHGIVHRDLKPENILVVRHGDAYTCKVVDFGIAKSGQEGEFTPNEDTINTAVQRTVSRLTQHGAILGSPQYMSPEQARGANNVDHRADLWSLSVCLYECIAGYRPFDDESLDQLLLKLLMHEPQRPPEVPLTLWHILERGLAKNRDERWQDASDFGEALALWLVDHGINVDASGRALRSRWLGEASIADQSQPIQALTVSRSNVAPSVAPDEIPTEQNNRPLMIASGVAFAAVIALGSYLLLTSPSSDAQATSSDASTEGGAERAAAEPPQDADSAAPPPSSAPAAPTVTPSAENAGVEPSADPSASTAPEPTPGVPHTRFPRPTSAPTPPPSPKKGPKDGLILPSDADF